MKKRRSRPFKRGGARFGFYHFHLRRTAAAAAAAAAVCCAVYFGGNLLLSGEALAADRLGRAALFLGADSAFPASSPLFDRRELPSRLFRLALPDGPDAADSPLSAGVFREADEDITISMPAVAVSAPPPPSPEKPPPEPTRELGENEVPVEDITVMPAAGGSYEALGNIMMLNRTSYDIDMEALLAAPLPFEYDAEKTQVLVIHTHGSECYNPEGSAGYDTVANGRSRDPAVGVMAVGELFCRILNENGVSAVHDTAVHDYPSYNGSYNSSNAAITELKKQYPDLVCVVDIHRDALEGSEGQMYNPVVVHDGEKYAQLMLVMGTDEGGLSHPDWRDNLKLAFKLEKAGNDVIEGLFRPMSVRSQRFNQHQTPGSLLIEVGSAASTLPQAERSAELAARLLAGVIKGKQPS